MNVTIDESVSPAEVSPPDLQRIARTTGLLYLGLAVIGMLGFLLVREQIFVTDVPADTLANLVGNASLARVGIALELGIVITQALCAVWFFRLFRGVDSFAAGSLAAFGLANAVTILGSAAMLATALDVAGDPSLAAAGDSAATAQLMYVVSGNLWGVGSIFFGLWLIPMGWLVLRSGWMSNVLGWILVGGGATYVASAFVVYLFPDANTVVNLMTMPGTIGEFWILGHLIIRGVRSQPGSRGGATG